MRLVGLTGGIASGKSTLAAALRDLGAAVIDADAIARDAVRRGTPALDAIVAAFGPGVLAADGELDRAAMASRVFADAGARARLEAIVHPAVRASVAAETARLAAASHDIAFYDVPLLYERGLERDLDCVVVVHVPPEVQVARLCARDRIGEADARARLAAQMRIEEKARRADVLVENDGTPDDLRGRAAPLLRALRSGLGRRLPNAPPARY
jgi:dephospho-CoA kinase